MKEAENPNNKEIANYSKSHPELAKLNQQAYEQELQKWEIQYPAEPLHFVKQRLLQFLEVTKDVDFTASLTAKNGKMLFVNPVYETQKSYYWKMAFRAGKEVLEPARAFAQQWVEESNNTGK